jgi:hypothetical protein
MQPQRRIMRWPLVGAILFAGLLTGCAHGAYSVGASADFSYPYPLYYRAYPYGYYGYPYYGRPYYGYAYLGYPYYGYPYYGYPYYAPYSYWGGYYYPYGGVGMWGGYPSSRPIWGGQPHRGR